MHYYNIIIYIIYYTYTHTKVLGTETQRDAGGERSEGVRGGHSDQVTSKCSLITFNPLGVYEVVLAKEFTTVSASSLENPAIPTLCCSELLWPRP